MANTRIFSCHKVVSNTVAIDGLSVVGFSPAYAQVLASAPESAYGVEDIDRAALRIPVRLVTSDVTIINALLAASPGATTFYCQQSASADETKITLTSIVWSGFGLNCNFNGDAVLSIDGLIRAAASSTALNAMIAMARDQSASAGAYPTRLWRPNTISFDPDGADPAIALGHAVSMSMSCACAVLEDSLEDLNRNRWKLSAVMALPPSEIDKFTLEDFNGVVQAYNEINREMSGSKIRTPRPMKQKYWDNIQKFHNLGK